MRIALIALCLATRIAQADSAADAKAVDAAIHEVLDGDQPWGEHGWERLGDIKLAGPSGGTITTHNELGLELIDCGPPSDILWKLGTPSIGVDSKRGFAWFQASASVDVTCMAAGFAAPSAQDTLRASGILVLDKSKWRLVALALSRQLPDAALYKGATLAPVTSDPTLDDSDVAKAVAAWFTKGGLTRSKASHDLVASGTAKAEYATGAGAAKLAAAWDKLALRPNSIEATVFANGQVALVRVDVPIPHKKKAAPMTLYAIAILDGKVWRWASLQFTSELAKAPASVVPDTTGIECPHGKC